ncbi:MAG: hypothetical protein PHN69_03410 [Candidatus Pacebacteria bacterium]|nr:hypothetical protein [Candidatus Paceibacterota bacterium]
MGIFFNDPKPRITETEFKKVRSRLYSKGFTTEQLDKIESIFRGDMYEDKDSDKGIDEKELERALTWMRDNTSTHNISEQKITVLEEEMRKAL